MGKQVKKRKKPWNKCPWCGYKPTGKLNDRRRLLMQHYSGPLSCPHETMGIPIDPIAEVIE